MSHRKKIYVSITKILLVLLREIKDIYSDNHTENITTLCEINLELFNVQGSGIYINLQGCITECYDKYDIKGTSAQHYLLSHSNSVSDYMFRPSKWSSSGLPS